MTDKDLEEKVSEWWKKKYKEVDRHYLFGNYSGHYMTNNSILQLAKYFYELGLKNN